MSSELIPSEQPTGVCDPSTGLECRVFRIEDHFGNIRQSVGDPDRVTRAVVRGFERRGVSYVITESSEAVENVWGTSAQEPVTLTPIPATRGRLRTAR